MENNEIISTVAKALGMVEVETELEQEGSVRYDYKCPDGSLIPISEDYYGNFNPLSNDSQCLQLIKRFGICLKPSFTSVDGVVQWTAMCIGSFLFGFPEENNIVVVVEADSVNMAVCLCVIEIFKQTH